MNNETPEIWISSLMDLPEVIQELIYNNVWSIYGRIDGINVNFGKSSYVNSPDLSEYYWMSGDSRNDFLLSLIENIKQSDSSMLRR